MDLRQPTYSSIAVAADLLGDQLNPDPNAKMDRQNISFDLTIFKAMANFFVLLVSLFMSLSHLNFIKHFCVI